MSQRSQKKGKSRSQYTANLALAAVASQVGCVTIVIVLIALLAGLWLDSRFGTSPIFLATLLIASVPLTVVTMLWIVRSVTSRIKPSSQIETKETQEETYRGTNAR
jgi:F0F1-type ATP synthase assembly protein I